MSENRRVAAAMMESKSMGLAILLTVLFGPLGLLYVSIFWGIVLTIAAALVGALTFGLAAGVFWVISILWAIIAVKRRNDQVLDSL